MSTSASTPPNSVAAHPGSAGARPRIASSAATRAAVLSSGSVRPAAQRTAMSNPSGTLHLASGPAAVRRNLPRPARFRAARIEPGMTPQPAPLAVGLIGLPDLAGPLRRAGFRVVTGDGFLGAAERRETGRRRRRRAAGADPGDRRPAAWAPTSPRWPAAA